MEEVLIGQQKCLANEQCEIIQLSSKFLRLIGYSLRELQELFDGSYYPLIVSEDRQLVRRVLRELTPEHPDYVVDYRIQRKSGQILWVHEQGSLVRENGTDYYYCDVYDASLYYQRERFYSNVLSSLPNPVFVLDMDLRIKFINRAAMQMLGDSEGEWIGRPCSDMNSPLCGTPDCCVKRFLRGETPAIQHTVQGQYNRVTIAPIYEEDGTQSGYISVSTDVSELIRTQRDLQLSEERYRIAVNQTQDTIWELDIVKNTLYYSGISTHYDLPHVISDVPQILIDRGFIHPDSIRDVQRMYRRMIAGEQSLSYEIRTFDKSGASRWIRLTSTTLFDDGGQAVRAIGTSRDITQEKQLEARFFQERQYRDSLASDAMYAYEVNLTRDELLHLDNEWIKTFELIRTKSYSEFLEDVARTAVHPEDRQYMANVHSRQSLLALFSSGKREFHCEYRRKNESGRMIWVRSSIFLTLSAEGDVCCFVYLKDIDEEKQAELTLRRKAERDPLTGLYNRDAVLTLAEAALRDDHSGLCAVIMLDVDDFKRVNDTFGHLYGDAVLSETAEKLSNVFRKDDIIGRIGGDEFVVFLKGLPDEDTARHKCEQLMGQIARVYSSGDRECRISVSVGLAFFPQHGSSFVQLYQKADLALYHAKSHGKHRLSVYAREVGAP